MYFIDAVGRWLKEAGTPLLTEYSFFTSVWSLLRRGEYASERIRKPPYTYDGYRNRALIRRFQKQQLLAPDADFRAGVWHVLAAPKAASAEEALALVDPFCYVSHLSAMERYGLTDRSPQALHVTTLRSSAWSRARDELVARDRIKLEIEGRLPPLTKIGFHTIVRRRPVVEHQTVHPSKTMTLRPDRIRIATVGDVFLESLAQPHLCGGMHHVLDAWDHFAQNHLQEIITAVDRAPKKILKVRAGYILTERLGITDPKVLKWRAFAQRGGSQKLDAEAPYAERFSEEWMLSLNV